MEYYVIEYQLGKLGKSSGSDECLMGNLVDDSDEIINGVCKFRFSSEGL